ncbi:hypothetical protein ACJQWK_09240 [Exserohilum turcicum]
MSEQGANDATRASTFTRTLHRTPASGLSPHANTLPPGLNVLVIGASRGIGASMACAYACAGAATLILAARSSSGAALAAVAEQVRAESRDAGTTTTTVLTETIDITSSDSMAQLAARVKQATQGKLDIVVFNSGYSGPIVKRVEEGDPRDFHAVFDVNVQDLTDDVKLCGAFCVWLSREKRMWLSGRLLSATWDVDELLEKKDQIQEQDLLKFGYRVGGGNA